jgi:hypothetical protein
LKSGSWDDPYDIRGVISSFFLGEMKKILVTTKKERVLENCWSKKKT